MLGVVAAGAAVFGERELLGCVGLVSFGNVVEMTAFGAFQA